MIKQTRSSSHIIQMYTLLNGDLEALVCLSPSQSAMNTLITVRAHTIDATITSAVVIGSFLYSGEMRGPQGLKESSCRNSSFIVTSSDLNEDDARPLKAAAGRVVWSLEY